MSRKAPLIACYSPKGGVGKTLVATGLALLHAAKSHPARGVLVDLDIEKGDVATLLQVASRRSILDWGPDETDLVAHKTGLKLLLAPPRLVDEGAVTRELTETVLDELAGRGEPIFIDLGRGLRDATIIALERATVVLLVTTPDLLAVRALHRLVQELHLLGLDLAKFQLVLNRQGRRQEITSQEVVELVGLPLAVVLPSRPALAVAANRGQIVEGLRAGGDFSQGLKGLLSQLLPEPPLPTLSPALGFGWLQRGRAET